MSLLSILGKIASVAGPVIAAPFTGGTSLLGLGANASKAIGAGVSGLGQVLGAGATASKNGRMQDASLQGQLDARNNAAALDAARFNIGTGATRAQQVAHGDVMSRPIPQAGSIGTGRNLQISGGVGPQLFGPDTQAAGEALKRQSLAALMGQTDQVHPSVSSIQKPGLLEKIGGVAGLVGGIAGALPQRGASSQGVGTITQMPSALPPLPLGTEMTANGYKLPFAGWDPNDPTQAAQ